MGYNGESVSVSIKYGGFQGDQIAKSWTESGQKIHTIYFPRKENRNASLLASKVIPLVPVFPC